MKAITVQEAKRLIEEEASYLEDAARSAYEGRDRQTMNEAIVAVQRGEDPEKVVRNLWED